MRAIAGVVLLLVVLAAIGGLRDASEELPTSPTRSPRPTATERRATQVPTAPPTPEPTELPGIGEPVLAGGWEITINGLEQRESGNQFLEPDEGNVYWVLDVTLTNRSGESQTAGSGIRLQDDQQFVHDADVFAIREPTLSGQVSDGATTRGYLTFQVGAGAKPLTVLFQPDIFDSDIVVVIDASDA